MAVSPLIMVRFSKFEIWHAELFDPDMPDVSDVTRDVTRRRHARARTSLWQHPGDSYTQHDVWHWDTWVVATCVVKGYLLNRLVDLLHFWHAS